MILEQSATATIVFLMVDATDLVTAETGLSPAVQISKNGGAFAASTNSASEIGNGWYSVALTATETGTVGPLIVRVTDATSAEWREYHQVSAGLPTDTSACTVTGIDAATGNEIADRVIGRTVTNVRSSSDRDTWSAGAERYTIVGAILATAGKNVASAGTLTTYQEDETTSGFTRPLTTVSAGTADDITGVG